MIRRSGPFGLLVLALTLGSAQAESPVVPRKLQVEDCRIEYREFGKSVPGQLLLAPFRREPRHGIAHLMAIDTTGKLLFHRPYEHFFKPLMAADFREIEPGYLGYFLVTEESDGREKAGYHFLDRSFQDVFLHPVPDRDPDLVARSAVRVPGGHEFFVFSRERRKGGRGRSGELQELDVKRNTPFTWNAEDYLKEPRDRETPLEIGSLAREPDGSWLLGLPASSEIVKISYPEGKPLWRLSSREWTFADDPRGGFQVPLSIAGTRPNSILLIDARGPGEPGRAVEYRLDPGSRKATRIWEFAAPGPIAAGQRATAQRLSNGNTVVAWGLPGEVAVQEVTAQGKVVRDWRVTSPGYSVPGAYFQARGKSVRAQ